MEQNQQAENFRTRHWHNKSEKQQIRTTTEKQQDNKK